MSQRQRTALRFPCGTAQEIAHPRYWLTEKSGVRFMLIRSGLTINR